MRPPLSLIPAPNELMRRCLYLLYASLLTPVASRNLLVYQSLPTSIPCRHANVRKQHLDNLRRKDPLRGAETNEISVRLGNYSASHFEGPAFSQFSRRDNKPQGAGIRPPAANPSATTLTL